MYKFVVLALTVSYVSAVPSYGGSGLGLGRGLGHTGGLGLGYNRGLGLGYNGGLGLSHGYAGGLGGYGGYAGCLGGSCGGYSKGLAGAYHGGILPAAIHSTRSYEVVPVPTTYDAAVPQTIEVGPNVQPVEFIFRTQSSPMNLQQYHHEGAPQYDSTHSEDAPSVVDHENVRSVVQNFRETIQPLRNIEQKVNPVIENVHTVVTKGEYHNNYAHGAVAPIGLAAPYDSHLGGGYGGYAGKYGAPALLSKGY